MAKKVLRGHLPDGRPVLFLKSQEEWGQRTRAEVERHHNFPKFVRTLEAMRQLTEQKGLKLVIVVLPTKGEVYPWILHGKNRLTEETLPSGFSQAVLSACDELGLRCFDAKPYFMQEAKRLWSSDGRTSLVAGRYPSWGARV